MTTKIITLEDHFSTGEPTVQLVSTWGRNGNILRESTSVQKIAAVKSPALDYIKSVTPEPGKSIVLIIGLGDHETYGPNRNGDGFPSEPVHGKIFEDEVLTRHYKSYKKAHVFRHHVNNDPEKAVGRVKEAFWNPSMRRVEVVEDFEHSRAPDLLEKIASGEFPAKSMGCRIKYDVCTLCGNKAKTRAEYCDHLKYEMGKIDGHTGKQAAALNPSPDFFDSSWVIRPADRTGYMLKKVAYARPYEISSYELGERVDDLKEKAAAIGKSADIEKVLDGKVEEAKSHLTDADIKLLSKYKNTVLPSAKNTKPLKINAIRIIAQYSPGDAIDTTDSIGMPLGLGELLQYFMSRMEPEHEHSDKITKSASAHVPVILKLLADHPRFCDSLIKESSLFDGGFNEKLANQLAPYAQDRLTTGDYLARRLLPANMYEGEPLTNTYSWTDPNTGHQYATNQYAIQQMHDTLSTTGYKNKLLKSAPLLGMSALLGVAAMGLGRKGFAHRGKAVAAGLGSAAAGMYGGYQLAKPATLPGPSIMTDQGKPISGWTEMVRTASADPAEMVYMIRRTLDKTSQVLSSNDTYAVYSAVKTATMADDEDTALLGTNLDLEKVATIVGNSIVTHTF